MIRNCGKLKMATYSLTLLPLREWGYFSSHRLWASLWLLWLIRVGGKNTRPVLGIAIRRTGTSHHGLLELPCKSLMASYHKGNGEALRWHDDMSSLPTARVLGFWEKPSWSPGQASYWLNNSREFQSVQPGIEESPSWVLLKSFTPQIMTCNKIVHVFSHYIFS